MSDMKRLLSSAYMLGYSDARNGKAIDPISTIERLTMNLNKSDSISRQDAIDKAYRLDLSDTGNAEAIYVVDVEEIKKLPSAERKGKWIYHSNPNIRGGMNPEDAYCSVCGFHIYTPEVDNFDDYNFCPNCGARMVSE